MEVQVREGEGWLARAWRRPSWVHVVAVVALLHLIGAALLFARRGAPDGAGGLRWGFAVNDDATHSTLPEEADAAPAPSAQPKPTDSPGVLGSLVSLLNKDDARPKPAAPQPAKLAPPTMEGRALRPRAALGSGGGAHAVAFMKEGSLGKVVGIGGFAGPGAPGLRGPGGGSASFGSGGFSQPRAAFAPRGRGDDSAGARRTMESLLRGGHLDSYSPASMLLGPSAAAGHRLSGSGSHGSNTDMGRSGSGSPGYGNTSGGGGGERGNLLPSGAEPKGGGAPEGPVSSDPRPPGTPAGTAPPGGQTTGDGSKPMGDQAKMAMIANDYTKAYGGFLDLNLERAKRLTTPYFGGAGRALDDVDKVLARAASDTGGWLGKKYPGAPDAVVAVLRAKDENTGAEIGPRQMLADARGLLAPAKVDAGASPDSDAAWDFIGKVEDKARLRLAAHDSLAEIVANSEKWYDSVHPPLASDCASAMAAAAGGMTPLPCQDLAKLEDAMTGASGYLTLLRHARDQVDKPLWSYLGAGGESEVVSIMHSHALNTKNLAAWFDRYKRVQGAPGKDPDVDFWQMPACREGVFHYKLTLMLEDVAVADKALYLAATDLNPEVRAASLILAQKLLVQSLWHTRQARDVVVNTDCPKSNAAE